MPREPHAIRKDLPPLPARMQRLPLDARGYPVPWFVAWLENDEEVPPGRGTPDFRVVARGRVAASYKGLCWVCGQPRGVHKSFVIGPMCMVNRTTSEPACHLECALWSAIACPFLSKPHAERRETKMPSHVPAPGFMIERNPGVAVVWTTRTCKPFNADPGVLFQLGPPEHIQCFREGRRATRAELMESLDSGFPRLLAAAETEGPESVSELHKMRAEAIRVFDEKFLG